WLTRPPEDQHEQRSRIRTFMLCAGIMIVSILAGYGSAQLLNSYRGEEVAGGGAWIKTVAGKWSIEKPREMEESAPAVERASTDDNVPEVTAQSEATDDIERTVKRVTTLPVKLENETPKAENDKADASESASTKPYRVASISVFADSVPEPKPARSTPEIPSVEPEAATVKPAETKPVQEPASIPGDDQERLFNRALQLIENHDIASARLMLRHLAEAGSGPAALRLAQSYDPEWLAEQGATGVPANNGMALRWYTMARDRGEAGTEDRIQSLSQTVRASN
ncbi:MAG: hypothetical protein ACR2O4_10085, partial [Hyphomicrobiaceae bacterium]